MSHVCLPENVTISPGRSGSPQGHQVKESVPGSQSHLVGHMSRTEGFQELIPFGQWRPLLELEPEPEALQQTCGRQEEHVLHHLISRTLSTACRENRSLTVNF